MNGSFFVYILTSSSFVDWIKSLTFKDYALMAGLIVLLAVLIVVITLFAKMSVSQDKFEKKLSNPNRQVRIIVINSPKQEVTSFALRNINNKKIESLNSFYNNFQPSERAKMIEWINSILNGTNEVPYLLMNYQRKSGKNNRRSVHFFFRLVNADQTTGIIHLESYMVGKSFRTRGVRKMLSSESELAESLSINGSATGMTFCFKLVEKKSSYQSKNKEDKKLDLEKRFTDYVSRYAVGSQKVLNLAPGEVAIANFTFTDLSESLLFALEVIYDVTEKLDHDLNENSKISNSFQIKCGIVSNRECLGDSDVIIREVSSTVNSIVKSPQPVAIYEKKTTGSATYSEEEIQEFDNEVSRLISEKRISYTFRPVYDVKHMKIYGYIARWTPINSSFSSATQMKNYAVRTGSLQTLVSAIMKNTIPKFVSERSDKEHRLFFPIRMDERDVMMPMLMRSRSVKDSNLYLTYVADDIQNALDANGVEKFLEQNEKLKEKDIRFAMVLKNNILNMDHRIYEKCDAFFVDLSLEDDFAKDAKVRSELHVLVEGLLKYKKPIIVTNLTTWNIVEIVVRSGVDYISSDMVAPYEKMMKPLPGKSVTKLQFMKEGK